MKTPAANQYRTLLGLLLALSFVCIAGFVFFFARMYQRDMQALIDFVASYQAYDQAVAAASASVFTASGESPSAARVEERLMDAALSDLKIKSSLQISSLIKNEDEAMRAANEIAELSDQEVSTFKAYRDSAGQDANRDVLKQAFHDLTKERQALFASFQELGE